MFLGKTAKQNRKLEKVHRKEIYSRVYDLHEKAEFLCYINEAYMERYNGRESIKLEGIVVKGVGKLQDTFWLYNCEGTKKADITMEELYLENNSVKQLEGGDKRVALYPREQEIPYRAGDILCKMKE